MCGIFGILIKPNTTLSNNSIEYILKKIALLSESRGKDSSGIALRNETEQMIHVFKGDIPIRQLLKSHELKNELKNGIHSFEKGNGFAAFGHARLVTNGSQLLEVNNQPVIKDDIITVHNGIIVNADELWKENVDIKREFLIDTEIIPALIKKELKQNHDLVFSVENAFSKLQGTWSVAMMFEDLDQFVLATNNGSLYLLSDNESFVIFASERYFLEQLKKETYFKCFNAKSKISHLLPDSVMVVNLSTLAIGQFDIKDKEKSVPANKIPAFNIQKHLLTNNTNQREVVIDPAFFINRGSEQHLFNLLEYNIDAIRKLKRCTKCLLPETFPFIEFDEQGICNYCHNHKTSKAAKTLDDLNVLVEPYRRKKGVPDCIVPFSGGRDSTYTLHIVKKELGLNPIAFTYDWGMVTDLARRNIARACGKLGVENIIISADINWKRKNIRKNIRAWLKSPSLGMIPLFMAGDKYFFYYCNKVKNQTGVDLNIWGINNLENTNFKTGFAGLRPVFDKKTIYALSLKNKLKLFGFVAGNILSSPGYCNGSMIDSLGSFAARYIAPKKDYYHLFDYYQWDEMEVNNLVKKEYDWELAIDTPTTWRIGDGTASFYNYIYNTVAGFSEFDTFRSNQIREGMLDREAGIKLIEGENYPRYETIRWYLKIIGLDFETVIKKINKIPKLYKL